MPTCPVECPACLRVPWPGDGSGGPNHGPKAKKSPGCWPSLVYPGVRIPGVTAVCPPPGKNPGSLHARSRVFPGWYCWGLFTMSNKRAVQFQPGPPRPGQEVLLSRAPPRTSSANCEAGTSTPRMPRQSSTPRRQTTMLNSAAPSAMKTEPATFSARLSRMSPGFDLSVHARIPSAINSPSTSGSSYSKPNKVIGR